MMIIFAVGIWACAIFVIYLTYRSNERVNNYYKTEKTERR